MSAQRPFWTAPEAARIALLILPASEQTAEIHAECRAKAAVVADSHMGDHAHRSARQDREARVGPADIRQQHIRDLWSRVVISVVPP